MHRTLLTAAAALLLTAWLAPATAQEPSESAFLFSYFTGNGEDGLHLAYSNDGYRFEALAGGRSLLAPEVGGKLMRDPCICRGPDGKFHMVWTSSWDEQGIGLAHSDDLINWSEQKFVPVMEHEPDAHNCWAPEIDYDPKRKQFLIFWSTTIPGRFPETEQGGDRAGRTRLNHRIYATTTNDFESFSPTQLFYNPGFNCIDATIEQEGDRYVMFIKDETRFPEPEKNIHIATANDIMGPYGDASEKISPDWVEGPTALKVDGAWRLIYDAYTRGHFEGVESRDLENWTSISEKLEFPEGARHGTIFRAPAAVLQKLKELQ